jgi:hypothetical protein
VREAGGGGGGAGDAERLVTGGKKEGGWGGWMRGLRRLNAWGRGRGQGASRDSKLTLTA